MKARLFPSLVLGALLCSPAHGAGEGYLNFIHQTQLSTGVVWSMPVVPKGEGPSALTMETGGALFQLWTIKQDMGTEYLLDQKLVGDYIPAATVAIKTLDSFSAVPRTRADQPFTVSVTVSGLLTGTDLPDSATRVLMEHHLASFAKDQTSINPTAATAGTPASSAYLTSNGTTTLSFSSTNLVATDPTKACGEEHFVIQALSDGNFSQTRLATARVQIWPVASGTIAGIADGNRIRFKAPELTVALTDLYPRSNTWLQVYPGSPQLDTAGAAITGSVLVLDQSHSESRLLTVTDYDTLLPEDGTYTIELLTETPFGIDRLDQVTFSVDRTLQIRGQLSTIEGQ